LALLPFLISCLIWLDLVASLPLIKERILVIILLLHFLSLMLGSVLVLMLPLLVWLTPDLRIKKSLLKCNWTIRKISVLVIRLRSLRLLRVSGIVMRLRMFLLLITFLKASHSFRNRLLVICKNAYLFATMIMTSVSSPFSCCSGIVRLNLM